MQAGGTVRVRDVSKLTVIREPKACSRYFLVSSVSSKTKQHA